MDVDDQMSQRAIIENALLIFILIFPQTIKPLKVDEIWTQKPEPEPHDNKTNISDIQLKLKFAKFKNKSIKVDLGIEWLQHLIATKGQPTHWTRQKL